MQDDVPREVRRKRLYGLHLYHTDQGNTRVAHVIGKQRDTLPIGGIEPDEPRNLVAHCGTWHPVTRLPLRLACCGCVLGEVHDGEEEEPHA